jgi:4-amino-4-deoxy-L-arabinose transferase-like glycosyltransferase
MVRLETSCTPVLEDTGQSPPSYAFSPDLRSRAMAWLVLAFGCGLLFFYGLGTSELYRTENLRALVADGFLRSGNWIVPKLYGEPLLTKPPGMYAAIAVASWRAGRVQEWSARLPSAIAATITLLLVYQFFARQLGRQAGLIAALVTPTTFMWLDKATAAEIDMMQVAWVTGAILCMARALEAAEGNGAGRTSRTEWCWWLAASCCVAGGVLTKWTAPAFFYATAIPLLWWRGRLRTLVAWPHLLGVLLVAGVFCAWAGAVVFQVGWDSFYQTVSREGLARVTPERYGKPYVWHKVPLHPLLLMATNLPWSVVALFTLRPGFTALWDESGRRMLQLLHCWTWPNMLFWSFIAEHAPRHSFPLFPGLTSLAAMVWIVWHRGQLDWPWPRVAPVRILVAIVIVWVGVKVVFVEKVLPGHIAARQARAKGEQLAALVPPDKTLYVLQLRNKDEGIMYYYGRRVERLSNRDSTPPPSDAFYCFVEQPEWDDWPFDRPGSVLLRMLDEAGDPTLLVRVDAAVENSSPPEPN